MCKVCITTIQRLYSMLRGEADFEEGNEEGSMFEAAMGLIKEPLPVVSSAHFHLWIGNNPRATGGARIFVLKPLEYPWDLVA